ncbi:MAG: hypothetical protein O6946_06855 [Gammaproteobacteria bacterium]|nr:hypothetical protein [Gammaproteobacteria bacterium]MCZ6716767.1 hypothetical protein [Gammaproteobacteria bacterium]MCZ6827217.1 hypothetical protein [Gammaproteobacteria bacterium]
MSEDGKLEFWHPLISGDPESVHRAGISVRKFALKDNDIHETDYEDHLIIERIDG